MLAIRAAKVTMVAAIALFTSLVTFGNLTDYNTNFAFVQHVLSMDTIFAFSAIKYRAITDPALQHAAYATIIATEAVRPGNRAWPWARGGGASILRQRGFRKPPGASRRSIPLSGKRKKGQGYPAPRKQYGRWRLPARRRRTIATAC